MYLSKIKFTFYQQHIHFITVTLNKVKKK